MRVLQHTLRNVMSIVMMAVVFSSTPSAYAQEVAPLWSYLFGGQGVGDGSGVAIDADGNIVVTGWFTSTVDFGGGPITSAGSMDVFIARFDAAGNHLWSTGYGSTGSDIGQGVAVDPDGNVIVTGYFERTVDFGGGPLTAAGSPIEPDIFIAKYAPDGSHLWSQRFGSFDGDFGADVAVDDNGNIILTGSFQETVDFGGGPFKAGGGVDAFVVKFAPDGAHLWSRSFGGIAGSGGGVAVAVASDGDVLVTGSFTGAVDFGGSPITSGGLNDIFLAKYFADGSHVWSRGFGGSGADRVGGMTVDHTGKINLTGRFVGMASFGGDRLHSLGGSADIFIARYDPAGHHVWSRRFGGSDDDWGDGIATDGTGHVLVTGTFEGTASFGGKVFQAIFAQDLFIAKYTASGIHLWSEAMGAPEGYSDVGRDIAADTSGRFVATGNIMGDIFFAGYECLSQCPADLDGSGAVDAADILSVLAEWGPCVFCIEDLDGSSVVSFTDLIQVLNAWGPCP